MHKYSDLINKYIEKELDLEELLVNLPEESERIFENCIIDIITRTSNAEDDAYKILRNSNLDENVVYKAFYLLCSLYRRRKDITIYGSLFTQYGSRFEKNDTYGYLKAMYLSQTGLLENIRQAVILAEKSLNKINNNVGIKHCYCEMVAEAFEEKIFKIDNDKDCKELNKATEAIEEIIRYSEEDYAKFYCTYGRILALSKNFNEAKIQIKKAIDKEKSDRADYSLRISEYIKHLMAITSYEQMSEVEANINICGKEIEKFQGKIDDTLNKNIEFLGFFAALVSFVIASVQLLTNQSFEDAVKLIVVLGGVQMLVIGSFSIILSGKKGLNRSIIVFIMALVTIVVGVKII